MTRTIPLKYAAAGLALAGLTLAACGGDDDDSADAGLSSGSEVRTINIEMRDNVFSPDQVDVEADETVRLVFRNEGAVTHDAFIGDEAAQEAHEMEMREADESGDTEGMDMGDDAGDDADMGEGTDDEVAADEGITVEAGESGEMTYTFRAGDELLIGCHEPDHYEAGMKATVNVT